MRFHVLTLFPEMIRQGLSPSIIGRAVEKGKIALNAVDIRAYTEEKHGKTDDYPYGGGAGMLMQAQPVYDAWKAVTGGKRLCTVYLTPQGTPFTQKKAKELAKEEEIVLLCGHYEGIDQRALEEIVTDEISVGDYVLTGGELPAMVLIDAVARLVPGVLGNGESSQEESFFNDLLEYPQYSRPEVWHGKRTPEVLLSGNHEKIRQWRLEQAKEKTAAVRPDLYARYCEKQELIQRLSKEKRNHIHIMESLARGRGEILWQRGGECAVYDAEAATCMLQTVRENTEADAMALLRKVPREAEWVLAPGDFWREEMAAEGYELWGRCSQYLYTAREPLPVKFPGIRRLEEADAPYVTERYDVEPEEYIRERIRDGMMYGAFAEERQIGFIGLHKEGSMGMLYVEEAFRRQGVAAALVAYCVNRHLEKGWIPYGQVKEGNLASERLQEKLGFYKASAAICWMKGKRDAE